MWTGRCDHPRMAGEVVERPRRLGEEAVQLASRLVGARFDELLLVRMRRLQMQEHVDVVPVSARGGDAARAGVRLFQQTHGFQVSHHRTNGGGRAVDAGQASDRLAAYWLAAVDVIVDDGSEDAAGPFTERRIPLGSGNLPSRTTSHPTPCSAHLLKALAGIQCGPENGDSRNARSRPARRPGIRPFGPGGGPPRACRAASCHYPPGYAAPAPAARPCGAHHRAAWSRPDARPRPHDTDR